MEMEMNRNFEKGIIEYHNRIHWTYRGHDNNVPSSSHNLHHYYHNAVDDLTITAESNQLCCGHLISIGGRYENTKISSNK